MRKTAGTVLILFISFFQVIQSRAQQTDTVDGRVITLTEVIVRSKTDIRGFMERVKADTSFYKAFRNLRVLEFTSLDFVHGFKIPDLNVRSDLPPGRVTKVRVKFERPGEYAFLCDNFCGDDHEEMAGKFVVT